MGCRVLVDGSALSSRWLQDTLEPAGCEVLLATGEDARDLQESREFDLVLTEHQLPESARPVSLWHMKAATPLPIGIMVTEEALRSIVEGMRRRPDDWRVKPFRPGALLDALQHALARREVPEPAAGR